jgi:hypothetical protein
MQCMEKYTPWPAWHANFKNLGTQKEVRSFIQIIL